MSSSLHSGGGHQGPDEVQGGPALKQTCQFVLKALQVSRCGKFELDNHQTCQGSGIQRRSFGRRTGLETDKSG